MKLAYNLFGDPPKTDTPKLYSKHDSATIQSLLYEHMWPLLQNRDSPNTSTTATRLNHVDPRDFRWKPVRPPEVEREANLRGVTGEGF